MIPLAKAEKYAARIAAELAPFCEQPPIVAGSIRRGRPLVGDIDLVILPRDVAAIKARCKRNGRVTTDGPLNFTCMLPGEIQLDIFFAHAGKPDIFEPDPTNLGAVLLCRTGSLLHNQWLCSYAQSLGLKFEPYRGVTRPASAGGRSRVIASASEAAIYNALQMPYLEPCDREDLPTIRDAIARIGRAAKRKAVAAS